jgi:hypothetical protein
MLLVLLMLLLLLFGEWGEKSILSFGSTCLDMIS